MLTYTPSHWKSILKPIRSIELIVTPSLANLPPQCDLGPGISLPRPNLDRSAR